MDKQNIAVKTKVKFHSFD